MTHLCVWYDSFICATRLILMCDMIHSYMRHSLFICVIRLIHMCLIQLFHMCDMTYSYVRPALCKCVLWLIHIRVLIRYDAQRVHLCDMRIPVWYDSITCMTWLIHTYICDMTESYVFPCDMTNSCEIRLINMRDMTNSCVWYDSAPYPTRRSVRHDSLMCAMIYTYTWHDSFIRVAWLVPHHVQMVYLCDMTHTYAWHDLSMYVIWLIRISNENRMFV